MENNKIPFNYFYTMFITETRKNILGCEKDGHINNIFNQYFLRDISNDTILNIYNKALYETCSNYISLSNTNLDVFPSDTLEFVSLIIETIEDNPYKESFLMSLQFIYQDYFKCLGKGYPILMSSENLDSVSYLQITVDSSHQFASFDMTNMDILEQDKIITKMILMEEHKQIGPIPKVLIHTRKDI